MKLYLNVALFETQQEINTMDSIKSFFSKNWMHFAVIVIFFVIARMYFAPQFDDYGLEQHDIEQYIGQRILPPLIQMVEDVKKREILEAQKTKIKRELNAIRKNITITLEDKPTVVIPLIIST